MKRWETVSKIKNQKSKIKIEDIVKLLLKNRGIRTKAQEKEFFNPTHPDKLKPKDFGIDPKELKKAVARIKKAKKTREKVIVWGDYDADGICGAAILWEALYYWGVNALPFIPERRTEGYGLNIPRMKQLKEEDSSVGLIITVDNGIVAHEKIDTAKELGVDVIITDHHLPRKTRPKAYAIIHTTKICGAAVAYLLAQKIKNEKLNIKIDEWKDWLGLVALAMIADMVPLVGVGRSLVYHGIPILQQTKRNGIGQLCKVARIEQKELGTYEIGFILAPRLNAKGRLESALDSLRLLCTKSIKKAQDLAFELNETNRNRQQMVAEMVLHAREQVMKVSGDGLIFVSHETYHEGVVGLVAGKLTEEFGRPALVVSRGPEFSKGSARSINGFNIVELLDLGREYLVEGGGHAMAAGFTVRTCDLEIFANHLIKNASKRLKSAILGSKLRIDCKIPLTAATLELAQEIEKFIPFGIGNPQPVFITRGVEVVDARLVGGDGKHLKLKLGSPVAGAPGSWSAIAFGMGEFYSKLSPEKSVDIVYAIEIDSWNRERKLQLKLKDLVVHD